MFFPHDPSYVRKFCRNTDSHGRYRHDHIIRTASMGEGPNLVFEHKGFTPEWGWRTVRENLESLDQEGRIEWSASGRPYLKRRLYEQKGTPVFSIITDISRLTAKATERLGYPTQKPVALLDRVIKASSQDGDVVLDPFRGCGATVVAANRLNRRWAGIDISSFAVDLITKKRLQGTAVATRGIPTDIASARKLARERPFSFEEWAVMRLPGFAPNIKKVGDGGVEGRARLATTPHNFDSRLALAQVKGGKFTLGTLRDFVHVTRRDKAALGCYITLDPVSTPASKGEVADFGKISVAGYQYRRMQLWPIADYFDQRLPSMPIMNDPYSGKPMQPTLGLFA